jgi:hypothetical protein
LVIRAQKEREIESEKSIDRGKDATHAQEQTTKDTSDFHVLQFAKGKIFYTRFIPKGTIFCCAA